MRLLRQSTAFTFRAGPFLDATDGVTAETGLSIAQADIQISKAGGAFAQTSASPTTTHDADGWYQCPLTSTDTNTLGTFTVQIVMAGALVVWEHFMVVTANYFDSVCSTDLFDVSVVQFNGTNGTFASGRPEVNATHAAGTAWASGAITAASIADGAITAAKIADGAIDAATFAAGAINAAAIASDAITAAKIADGAIDAATFAAGAINAAAIASDAITDAKVAADVTIASVTGSVGSVSGAVGSVTGAVGSVTGNVGGNVVGSVASVTGNVGGNVVGNVNGSVGSVAAGGISASSFAAGAIDAAAIAADAIGSSELAATATAEIATAVRTELATELARVDVATSTRLATAGYTAPLDAAGTRTAVGMASANLDTQLGNINSKTTNLPADPADASDVAAAIAALNNISASDVLTQVNAALNTAMSELGVAAPSATPTLRTAVMLLYMALRNRTTTTASAQTIQNDAGTTIATAALADDGTTFSKAEFA